MSPALRHLALLLILVLGGGVGPFGETHAVASYGYEAPTQAVMATHHVASLASTGTTRGHATRTDAHSGRPSLRTPPVVVRLASGFGLAAKGGKLPWAGHRPYAPNRELPRYPSGRPKPESPYPHSQLGTRKGRYPQSREFDENGRPVRDIDWTDHGNPDWHTDPHQHVYGPDGSRGGPASVWP